jgi:hypothetical protein
LRHLEQKQVTYLTQHYVRKTSSQRWRASRHRRQEGSTFRMMLALHLGVAHMQVRQNAPYGVEMIPWNLLVRSLSDEFSQDSHSGGRVHSKFVEDETRIARERNFMIDLMFSTLETDEFATEENQQGGISLTDAPSTFPVSSRWS